MSSDAYDPDLADLSDEERAQLEEESQQLPGEDHSAWAVRAARLRQQYADQAAARAAAPAPQPEQSTPDPAETGEDTPTQLRS